MKNYYKLLVLFTIVLFFSCEKGEIFTGSPLDNGVSIETIVGIVTINESLIVDTQKVPITVTLPRTFDENVNIQATIFIPSTNKRVNTSFILPAGQSSITTEISSPPIDNVVLSYVIEAQVFLTALGTDPLKPSVGFDGKQYILTSNIAKFDFGPDTVAPNISSSRLSVRLDCESPKYSGATIYNELNLVLKKNNGSIVQPINNTPASFGFSGTNSTSLSETRYDDINISNIDAPADTYTISIHARKLILTPSNLKYRFVVRFPNKTIKTYTGVLNDLVVTNASQAIVKLQIVKSTNSTDMYSVTQI
jgi:hypothetical protein